MLRFGTLMHERSVQALSQRVSLSISRASVDLMNDRYIENILMKFSRPLQGNLGQKENKN